MASDDKIEERVVTKEELSSGVQVKAGHRVVLLLGAGAGPSGGDSSGDPSSGGASDETGDTSGPDGETGSGSDSGGGGSEPGAGGDSPGADSDSSGEGSDPSSAGSDSSGAGSDPSRGSATSAEETGAALEVRAVTPGGEPRQKLEWKVTLPGGSTQAGKTDGEGKLRIESLASGAECQVEYPDVLPPAEPPKPAEGRLAYAAGGVVVKAGTPAEIEAPLTVRRGRLKGMLFDTDKTFLRPEAMRGIRQLKILYDSYPHLAVLISGHADRQGADKHYNRSLSTERARSIRAFLLDDVGGWLGYYGSPKVSKRWGTLEDQYMLAALKDDAGAPFYAGTVDGKAGPQTADAFRRFQAAHSLPQSGAADSATRKALVTAYMAQEGTSLPADTAVAVHGCGQMHPAVDPSPADEPRNRRVEVFLFEGSAAPPPQEPCPDGGCVEYPQWLAQTGLTVDLDDPPGRLRIKVVGPDGASLSGAAVHITGPISGDATAGADGVARFADLVPGNYRVLASKDGFSAGETAVTVASGSGGKAAAAPKAMAYEGSEDSTAAAADGGVDATIPLPPKPATVTKLIVKVTDAAGTDLPDSDVRLGMYDRVPPTPSAKPPPGATWTFEIPDDISDTETITIHAKAKFFKESKVSETRPKIGGTKTVTVELTPATFDIIVNDKAVSVLAKDAVDGLGNAFKIVNFKDPAFPHGRINNSKGTSYKTPPKPSAKAVKWIVLHETAAFGNGCASNFPVHFFIGEDTSTIYQCFDTASPGIHCGDSVIHAASVAIEFANQPFDWSPKWTDTAKTIPDQSKKEVSDGSKSAKPDSPHTRVYMTWVNSHSPELQIIVPPQEQLEKLVWLVRWLTDRPLGTDAAGAKVPRDWRHVFTSGSDKFFVPMSQNKANSAYYSHLHTAGILSHSVVWREDDDASLYHGDGGFQALYTWLRLAQGLAPAAAYTAALDIAARPPATAKSTPPKPGNIGSATTALPIFKGGSSTP